MATALTRWDPFTEIANMRNLMDRLFEQSFGRFPLMRNGEDIGVVTLGLDVYETPNDYVVKAAIPGVDPKDVEIRVDDDVLTIRGELTQKEEVSEDHWLRRELHYGSFQRQVTLPPTVDPQHAQATFENGMLTLRIPKKPEARTRSLRITPQGVIEGEQAQAQISGQQAQGNGQQAQAQA